MAPSVLIATTNRGKVREVGHILADLPIQWTALTDHAAVPEPVENADTFEGNARLKALYYAEFIGGWTLADDSGLEVDALGGEPGVHSSRYAGTAGDSAANNTKLLRALAAVPQGEWTARFQCVVVLARPSEVVATTSGTVAGRIVREARGAGGFGYDPHFFVPACGMTAAEMDPEIKNRISHRGQAFRAMIPALIRHLNLSV